MKNNNIFTNKTKICTKFQKIILFIINWETLRSMQKKNKIEQTVEREFVKIGHI